VDSREASPDKPVSLSRKFKAPRAVKKVNGFVNFSDRELIEFITDNGLAMSFDDILLCREYFQTVERRDPSITEIKILDTYWSDHCRHTTFATRINKVEFEEGDLNQPVREAFKKYKSTQKDILKQDRALTLMNIATLSMKEMRARGLLDDLELTSEINACSIIRKIEVDGRDEEWLIMFKNETHNHPTEIEPFGGAATCLGGAIRDPLSGRSYVYQAMRVTGSGDPREKIEGTLKGKLPQRKITVEAAHGYSSYGNQIGLATGLVTEIYHQGYKAKRMEVGAVVGAVKRSYVRREEPQPGDLILMVGGKTGRDGIGGATGSSKEHTTTSITGASAEVQKGNPVEERKLQRLFRNPKVTKLIKKSNDFGAGGVSVAVGELADGLDINLDVVPKKYMGLDGTELALSESQERMAVVVEKDDCDEFIVCAEAENLKAVKIAEVTGNNRLMMRYQGDLIVDISREFLDSNGATQNADVFVCAPDPDFNFFNISLFERGGSFTDRLYATLSDLNVCSQQGLVERFDSTVGKGSVFLPFGGQYQNSPMSSMAAKIPLINQHTGQATIMSFGFNPLLSVWSPFHGAVYAVIESVSKIVAGGADAKKVRLSLQEYFERIRKDKRRWGKPFAALLGAYYAASNLGIAAIGGKDSMSGTFEELDVPPTLISFAIDVIDAAQAVSSDFKKIKSKVVLIDVKRDDLEMPDFRNLKVCYTEVNTQIRRRNVLASSVVDPGGIASTIAKMSFGNMTGFAFTGQVQTDRLFLPLPGAIVLQLQEDADPDNLFNEGGYQLLGEVNDSGLIRYGREEAAVDVLLNEWQSPLEEVFPTGVKTPKSNPVKILSYNLRSTLKPATKLGRPRVLITSFPGTNCEIDTLQAFAGFGADAEVFLFRNLTTAMINDSLKEMKARIDRSQIVVIPGGFSLGDEPEGSGKFICAVFRNPLIRESIMNLLQKRDGLILGICNGFQALIKLGLLPFGEILELDRYSPTLTFNTIGRHISRSIYTRVSSVLSPWMMHYNVGDVLTAPISHGEGRFVADEEHLIVMEKNGQIATQYSDIQGDVSEDISINPNGSVMAVESITSIDGRILGKMAHPERMGRDLLKNISGNKDLKIFKAGVDYFK
jgi:phosphoribosylformylglycinamidine synthase